MEQEYKPFIRYAQIMNVIAIAVLLCLNVIYRTEYFLLEILLAAILWGVPFAIFYLRSFILINRYLKSRAAESGEEGARRRSFFFGYELDRIPRKELDKYARALRDDFHRSLDLYGYSLLAIFILFLLFHGKFFK